MEMSMLGNIEIVKTFMALHYEKYDFYYNELRDDPRTFEYELIIKDMKEKLGEAYHLEELYVLYFEEARRRGLNVTTYEKDMIDSQEFLDFRDEMLKKPTYVREIEATNFLGDYPIDYCDDPYVGFDYPVRDACILLNKKGYTTYWSSANREDVYNRFGKIVKDKNVAYILIDPTCLNAELKHVLDLDGSLDIHGIWGVAKTKFNDNGHYYGVYSEIEDENALCEDVSNDLLNKVMLLPDLTSENVRVI